MKTLYILLELTVIISVFSGPAAVTGFTSTSSTCTTSTSTSTTIRSRQGCRHRDNTSINAVPLDVVSTLYNQALLTNPLETKLATGAVLALAGDAIAQQSQAQSQAQSQPSSRDDDDGENEYKYTYEYDIKRAGAFVSFDILYRAFQCASFPEITRVCDGHYLGTVLPGIDVNVLATMEQTMGESDSQSIL